jgi:hypothetical protein
MKREAETIIAAAREMRQYLPALTGSNAPVIEQRLNEVFNGSPSLTDEELADQIVAVVRLVSSTRAWMRDYLHATSEDRSFSATPGKGEAILATIVYDCPYGDLRWYRRGIGQSPPTCPAHNVPLVAVR